MKSSDAINFRIRTNKNVERKLIFESIQFLREHFDISEYKYLGFGAAWFVDFLIAHKALAISDMVSIEGDEKTFTRAEFNRPFTCVELEYGDSTKVLPGLNLDDKPIIAWLDYDSNLDGPVWDDINHICNVAVSGSIILVTLNANASQLHDPSDNDTAIINEIEDILDSEATDESQKVRSIQRRLRERGDIFERRARGLESLVGAKNVPFELDPAEDLTRRNIPATLAKSIINHFENSMEESGRDEVFSPIYNFRYKDGAPMITVGGMISDDEDLERIEKSKVPNLHYISGREQVEIDVPPLTFKEKAALDSLLPKEHDEELTQEEIKNEYGFELDIEQVESYDKFYKQYPVYGELRF